MRNNIENSFWKADLSAFGKRNYLRPTRLEVLGADKNIESDFWLEDDLLLAGIALETDGEGGPSVEIMLEAQKATPNNHMTHNVMGVKRMALLNTASGWDEGLEIEDARGAITVMHFEDEAATPD
jgi:hypothetical protein